MNRFDTIAIVDWSGGNDTGPSSKKDAIWIGIERAGDVTTHYMRNRHIAEEFLHQLIRVERDNGRRIFIGFDFPFGYPDGFGRALTGSDNPFALWDWFAEHLQDSPKGNNRFDLAAQINHRFPGVGPFWFNGLAREIEGLPKKDTREGHGMAERRACELQARGAFTCWQMGGAGAVGSQVMTGLPILARLRAAFAGDVAVWPFEPLDAGVAIVEVWPSLIAPAIKAHMSETTIKDEVQVRILARAIASLAPKALSEMLDVPVTAEGWIFGLGHEETLSAAARSQENRLRPPPLRNDCFALPAGVDWTPVDEALSLLRSRLKPVVAEVISNVPAARGRILAQDAVAARANPPHANTAVDGYGFAHGTVPDLAEIRLPLVDGRSAAGVPYLDAVPPGHALRVLTGAAIPDGVDTVVLDEDVTVGQGEIVFRGGLKHGANTRAKGEDIDGGDLILPKGRLLTPADLALLSVAGLGQVAVYDQLRVGVLSTGDELVEAGSEAQAGQIHDANRPMLLAMAERWGFAPVDLGRVGDDRAQLRGKLDQAAGQVDVILTSGGASAGDEDHVSAVLREAGAMQSWRIALKPGRPLALGMWAGVPVFGLPGNPVAAMVCALVFARPAMGLMAGMDWAAPQGFDLPAAFVKRKKPGRREYLRARVRNGQVEVFKSEGSGRVSGLSWAEGLVELGEEEQTITPGDTVRYIPFGSFGL